MKKINLIITLVLCAFMVSAQSFAPVQHGGNALNDLVAPGVSAVCLDEPTPPVLTYSTTPNNTSLPNFAYVVETPSGLYVHEGGDLNLSSNGTLGWLNPGDMICVSAVAYDIVTLNGTAYGLAQTHVLGAVSGTGCTNLGIDPSSCDAIYNLYAGMNGIVDGPGNDDNENALTTFSDALLFTANLDVPPASSTSNLRSILNTVNNLVGTIQFSLSNSGFGNDYCISIGGLCNPIAQCGQSLGTLSNPLGITSICQDEANPPTLTLNTADNTSGLPDFAYVVEANGVLVSVEAGAPLDLFSSNLNFVEAGQQICVTGVAFDVATVNTVAYGLASVHTLGATTGTGCTNLGIAAGSCDAIYLLYAGPNGTIDGGGDDNVSALSTFADALVFLQNLDVPPPTSVDNLIYGLNIVNQLVGSICFALTNNGLGNDYCIDVTGPCNPIAQCGQSLGTLTAPSGQATVCRDGSDAPTLTLDPTTDNTSGLSDFAYLITSSDGTVAALDLNNTPTGSFDLGPGGTIGYLNPGDNFCVSGVAYDLATINMVAYGLAQVHTLGSTSSGCTNLGITTVSCDAIYLLYAGPNGVIDNGGDDNANAITDFNDAIAFTAQLSVPPPNSLGNIVVALNTINGLVGTMCFALTNGGNGGDYCYTVADCNPSISTCASTNNMPALACTGPTTLNADGSNAPTITYSNPMNSGLPDYALVFETPNGLSVLESGSAVLNPAGFGLNPGDDICVSAVAFDLAALNPVVAGLAATHTIGSTTSGCVNLGIAPTSCDNIFTLIAGPDGTVGTSDDGSINNFQEALDFTEQLDIYPSTSTENLILGLNVINGLVGTLCFSMSNNGVGNDCCYTVEAGCPPVLNVPGLVQTGTIQADDIITSNGQIITASGGPVTYFAGAVAGGSEYIELSSGFVADGTVDFTAINMDCDTTDN